MPYRASHPHVVGAPELYFPSFSSAAAIIDTNVTVITTTTTSCVTTVVVVAVIVDNVGSGIGECGGDVFVVVVVNGDVDVVGCTTGKNRQEEKRKKKRGWEDNSKYRSL